MNTYLLEKKPLAKAVRAVVLATSMGALTATLVGCKLTEGNTSVSTTDATTTKYQQEKAPKALVTGTVMDTNAEPIEGATVSVAGITTTTNANGQYRLEDVPVTIVQVQGAPAAPGANTELLILITPPAGTNYLGATTKVETFAQLSSDVIDAAGLGVFIDGLMAEAGIVALPSTGSSVTGQLIDSATGLPVPNTRVSFDLTRVANGNVEPITGPAAITYRHADYIATTDVNGIFLFNNLPNDSQLTLEVGRDTDNIDWDVQAPDPVEVNTKDGRDVGVDGPLDIGQVNVENITFKDDVPPYVVSVSGVLNQNALIGQLGRSVDGTQGIVFTLSEPVDADLQATAGSIKVYSETQEKYLAVNDMSLGNDERTITVKLATPLQPGELIHVYILNGDIKDKAGNLLIDTHAAAVDPVAFASAVHPQGYTKYSIKAFKQVTPIAGILNLSQDPIDTRDADFPVLAAASRAFMDNSHSNDNEITQLNSDADAGTRLTDLATALSLAAGITAPTNIEIDSARITFTPTGASKYELTVKDETGALVLPNVNLASGTNNLKNITPVPVPPPAVPTVKLEVDTDNSVNPYFLVQNVKPGYTVRIREVDEMGNVGPWKDQLLADNVPPTTIVQNSYGAPITVSGQIALTYGNGGELANEDATQIGFPRLNITPFLLSGQNDGLPNSVTNSDKQFDELYAARPVQTAGSEKGNPIGGQNTPRYDESAITSWMNTHDRTRTIGVAFSENIVSTANATFSGTATLTNWSALNDVTMNDAGLQLPIKADLVTFTVDDVLKLAKDDGATIDFTGVVQDKAGNSADSSAKVVVTDLMPPLVESAAYGLNSNGERELRVTFNKEVNIERWTTLSFGNHLVRAASDKAGTVIVFEQAEIRSGAAPILAENNLGPGPTSELIAEDGRFETPDPRYAVLRFENVKSANNGASWSDYAGPLTAPEFLVKVPEPFKSIQPPAVSGFTSGNTEFSVTYRFNHQPGRVGTANIINNDGDNIWDGNNAAASGFILNSGANIASNSSVTFSDAGKTVRFTFRLDAPLAVGDTLNLANSFEMHSMHKVFQSNLVTVNPFVSATWDEQISGWDVSVNVVTPEAQ